MSRPASVDPDALYQALADRYGAALKALDDTYMTRTERHARCQKTL